MGHIDDLLMLFPCRAQAQHYGAIQLNRCGFPIPLRPLTLIRRFLQIKILVARSLLPDSLVARLRP